MSTHGGFLKWRIPSRQHGIHYWSSTTTGWFGVPPFQDTSIHMRWLKAFYLTVRKCCHSAGICLLSTHDFMTPLASVAKSKTDPQVLAENSKTRVVILLTGWWFQTFFIVHNIWDNPSHWLIFFRGVETTNQLRLLWISLSCWVMLSHVKTFNQFWDWRNSRDNTKTKQH